jgi:hypothetical protein
MFVRWLSRCLFFCSSLANALTCSVIIPCHHTHFQHLAGLLEQCSRSTRWPDEIIISLSGVENIPPAELDAIQNQPRPFPVRFLLHQGPVSRGANRNRAAEVSTTDVLICQDADDLPHPERIAICMRVLEEDPSICMILHGCAMPLNGPPVTRHVYRLSAGAFLTSHYDKNPLPVFKYPQQGLPTKHHCFCNGVPIIRKFVWEDGLRWIEALQRTEDVKYVRSVLRKYSKNNVFVNLPLYFYRMSLSAGYEGRSIWMPEDQEEAI